MDVKKEISVKKFRRKIKIRLLDSSDPNSYVCEIFDSSLEQDEIEDETKKGSNSSLQKGKSYFEILMSSDFRKSVKNESTKENHEVMNKTKKMQGNLDKSNGVQSEKRINDKCQKRALETIRKSTFDSDSSDDESLFKVREKCLASNGFKTQHSKLQNHSTGFPKVMKNNGIEVIYQSNLNSKKNDFNNLFLKNQKTVQRNHIKVEKIENQLKVSSEKNSPNGLRKASMTECNEKKETKVINGGKKENLKLAPVFLMKEKKAMDLAAQKARRDFLHKETKLLKGTDKNIEIVIEFRPVCHVQQRDSSPFWSIRKSQMLPCEPHSTEEFKTGKVFRTNVTQTVPSLVHYKSDPSETLVCCSVDIDPKLIKELKAKYSNLNLDVVFDGLKVKKEKYKRLMKATSKVASDETNSYEFLNSLWTERYKPSSSEVLGNEKIVKKLKSWLEAWKKFDEELKNLAKINENKRKNKCKENGDDKDDDDDDDDDDDVFLNSDDENFGLKAPTSVCLLSGPNGCGKTALVSSLAEELDFNVLEVNASSKRTGKKVLTDFQEATKSHKVQHLSSSKLNKLAKPVKRKREKKTKKNSVLNGKRLMEESNERKKISLLLIEDADIVFEDHDEGFYSAVSSLVQTSKRPFIFITDNPDSDQLDNFKVDDCLLLEMKRPPFHHSCAVLDAVSLLEGVPVKKETVEFLVIQNNFDLRKSLLDLQFWYGARGEEIRRGEPFDLGRFWWELAKVYPEKPNDSLETVQFREYKRKRKDAANVASDEEDEIFTKRVKLGSENGGHISLPALEPEGKSKEPFEGLSILLDAASAMDLIGLPKGGDFLPGTEYSPKCSLSLEENMESVHFGENQLREEICSELRECSNRLFRLKGAKVRESDETNRNMFVPSWDDIRWKNSLEEARNELSNLVPVMNGRDNKSVHLDYLPIFRNICRVEKNREATNAKRKNRFLHYFNNSNVELTEKTLNMSCQTFGR